MAAQRGLVVDTGVRILDVDEGKDPESPTGKNFKAAKLPLLRWESAAGLTLGDLKSVRDLYDVKTLFVLFLIGSILLLPAVLKRKRVYE